jgi:hypothetical protein
MLLDDLGDTVRESRAARRVQLRLVVIFMFIGGMTGVLLPLLTAWLSVDPSPVQLLINTGVGGLLGAVFGGLVGYCCGK